MKHFFFYYLCLAFLLQACGVRGGNHEPIRPGQLWLDDRGVHINAHGGGVLYHKGTYYWYGEYKSDSTSKALVGITCYSSSNLTDWKNEGIALPVADNDTTSDIAKGCIMERPKVIYNKQTGKFVMWFHLELKGRGYGPARAAVAVSDSPTGPYCFIRSARVNSSIYPLNMTKKEKRIKWNLSEYEKWWTPEWYDAVEKGMFVKRDLEGGQMSRDMTLFVDDDGKAYHIFASETNSTIHIAELTDDFLDYTGKYVRAFVNRYMEAPAIFKKDGLYYFMGSGCTGWKPNAARSAVAPSIWGPWTELGNPCQGENSETTFHSQSTYILPVSGRKNVFIYIGDRWNPQNAIDGRYIWLPIDFQDNRFNIHWHNEWDLKYFDCK